MSGALALTLQLSVTTAVVLTLLGVPIAYWLAFTRHRLRFAIEAVVALPLVLPPTVLGYYLLVGLGPRGVVGGWYETIAGHPLVFRFEGLLIGSLIYSLPFAVQPFVASFRAVDPGLIEASWTLGESRLATFFRVVLPLSKTGVISGMVLAFAHTVGEFGVVLMVGGNIPGKTRTVSLEIYDHVQALDYAAAGRTSAGLLLFSFIVLSIVYALQWRPPTHAI